MGPTSRSLKGMHNVLAHGLVLQNADQRHAVEMELLQRKAFPHIDSNELITARHFLRHMSIFPEGQFIITDGRKVVASTSTFRCDYPPPYHTFLGVSGNLWMTTHKPDGAWLYSIDISVALNYRGLGLARELYQARHELCRTSGMRGQLTAGLPMQYHEVADRVSIEEYVEGVIKGRYFDSTLSIQLRMGFKPTAIIPNYMNEPRSAGHAILLELPADMEVSFGAGRESPAIAANQ